MDLLERICPLIVNSHTFLGSGFEIADTYDKVFIMITWLVSINGSSLKQALKGNS